MQGAIFDMDGLLIDSERLWQGVWHDLAAERGIALAPTFPGDICGTGGARTREVLRRYYPDDDPEVVLRECSARVHRLEEQGVPLKQGVRTILDGLRGEGYRIAVASSSPMYMILHNLRLDGVDGYFDVLTSGREVANCKPAPDIFLLAAKRLGLPPEECWVFEDSLSGIEAAWRAGCRPVMVPDLVQPNDDARQRSFCICHDLAEAWEKIKAE